MTTLGGGKANEFTFQNEMLKHLVAKGWRLGKMENYNRELAIYPKTYWVLSKKPRMNSGKNSARSTRAIQSSTFLSVLPPN